MGALVMNRFISASKFYLLFAVARVFIFNQRRYRSFKSEVIDVLVFSFLLSIGDIFLWVLLSSVGIRSNLISIIWFIYYSSYLHPIVQRKLRKYLK